MKKTKSVVYWVITISILLFSLLSIGTKVTAAGAPMIIDFKGELSNGLKTEAKGTINSIDDLSNGNFQAKLLTKSEQDPSELEQFILDGPIQINSFSSMNAVRGTVLSQSDKFFRFDVSSSEDPLPEVHISQVARTKSGQSLDLIIKITDIPKTAENCYLNIRVGNAGAVTLEMKNISGIHFSNQFVTTDGQEPLDILAFPAISDVDYAQAFELDAYPLGHGSNLTKTGDTRFSSDGTAVNSISDFPLGGILYQFFGNTLEAGYYCAGGTVIDTNQNGFDIFGAYGTIKDVEITKPDFGEVVVPKGEWTIQENEFQPGKESSAIFTQPINALDKDINHRYENWVTRLTIPKEFTQSTIQLLDSLGNVIPTTTTPLNETQYEVSVSPETMKQLQFNGESYHFKIDAQLSGNLIDQTALSFLSETLIDNKTDSISYQTQPIAHKSTVKVRYYRQETTDSIEKTRKYTFGYGKPWKVSPVSAPEGYYYDSSSTKDPLEGAIVDFSEKVVTCYYAPVEKTISVNYLDEHGEVLASNKLKANYQEAYTTSAVDLDDEYSLITDRIPENSAGIVGNTDSTVNYYYRKNRGNWIDLSYGIRSIARLDYHGHIRSNAINYEDGQILTLLNTKEGILLHQDTVSDGAISEKLISSGSRHVLRLSPTDSIVIEVKGIGSGTITRKNDRYVSITTFKKGNVTHTMRLYSGSILIEEQIHQANGVTGVLLKQQNTQWIAPSYKVVSNRVLNEPVTHSLNTKVVDASQTEYETRIHETQNMSTVNQTQSDVQLTARDKKTSKEKSFLSDFFMTAHAEVIEELPVIEDGEDIPAANDLTFSYTLKGSASLPEDPESSYDSEDADGDIDDEKHVQQQLSNKHDVKIFGGEKLLKEQTISENDMLTLTLPEKDRTTDSNSNAKPDPVILNVQPANDGDGMAVGQQAKNGDILPIKDGRLPKTGELKTNVLNLTGMFIVLIVLGFHVVMLKSGGRLYE